MELIHADGSLMKNTLTVLLIEDSADYTALVEQWLSFRADVTFVLHWTDSLQAGLTRLKDSGVVDVILLDLGLPDSDGYETFTRTKIHAFGVPVILLTGNNSEQLALQMVEDGAEDYMVKTSCNADLLTKAIQFAVARTGRRAEKIGAVPSA